MIFFPSAGSGLLTLFFALMHGHCQSPPKDKAPKSPWPEILALSDSRILKEVLSKPQKYECQLLYTQIDRRADNSPLFQSHALYLDEHRYFYPASGIKLPVALAAMEKLGTLRAKGIDRNTALLIDSASTGQTTAHTDSSSATGRPSVGQYLKKLFVVSDNDAYNRLYEFVGPAKLRQGLRDKGYDRARLTHRLSLPLSAAQNRRGNPFRFVDRNERELYREAERDDLAAPPIPKIEKGRGYRNAQGETVYEPKDFGEKNFMALADLQEILKSILFPASVSAKRRFALDSADRTFVLREMSRLPRESRRPSFDSSEYYDAYVKFLMFGASRERIPDRLRIFNKIGLAYGYAVENAYVADFGQGLEFMVSAVVYTNENGIFNDNIYEYEQIAFPFLRDLGRAIYLYEQKRPRSRKPDLSEFQFDYKEK